MPASDGDKDGNGPSTKPKRVRTGCLTCRERHLKCDEAMPSCNNCRKSNRECKRGLRLNFIDIWVDRPPKEVTLWGTAGWKVDFMDESRDIAGEYKGGLAKYKAIPQNVPMVMDPSLMYGDTTTPKKASIVPALATMAMQPLPPMQSIAHTSYPDLQPFQQADLLSHGFDTDYQRESIAHSLQAPHSGSNNGSQYGGSNSVAETRHGSIIGWPNGHTDSAENDNDHKDYLETQEETLFMQVFVEEVGSWMDSMDQMKHFSRLLPFHALSEPMLLNAFFACGARHLTLVNSSYQEEKALHYYDTATRYLLKNLQNPNRDTVVCATTAVILNVYEIMSERALQRMNHIAGARALIKECGWSARSQGIGAACFWLNVGLEVLSCLHFNWQVAWDPDDWGLDMDLTREVQNCKEELWTHRMLYLVAKVCNLRATSSHFQEGDSRDHSDRIQKRYDDWCRLKAMIDTWNASIPRTMHPIAYVQPFQRSSKSLFPEVWLIKRTTIVARLFYHTAMLLLAQINPLFGSENVEMADLQMQHSRMICGIVAHVTDRGVASVAIRSLAHAAEVLTDRREQEEVISIFEKINSQTGWRIGFVYKELKTRWGWHEDVSSHQFSQTHTAAQQQRESIDATRSRSYDLLSQVSAPHTIRTKSVTTLPPPLVVPTTSSHASSTPSSSGHNYPRTPTNNTTPPSRPPAGILNPMYAKADFNLPQHPYQNFYVAPNQEHQHLHQFSLGLANGSHYSGAASMGI